MNALIITDIQHDFLPGGALAVPGGDEIIPLANELQKYFDLIVATQDWHPADHGSFAANHPGKKPGDIIDLYGLTQILWPIHCVQGTYGAELSAMLDTSRIDKIIRKATDSKIDSYSAFFDNGHRKDTGMASYLKDNEVTDIYIIGLATDYCVKYSALDARKLGFNTYVIEDACKGINLESGDIEKAIDEMREAGVIVLKSSDIIGHRSDEN